MVGADGKLGTFPPRVPRGNPARVGSGRFEENSPSPDPDRPVARASRSAPPALLPPNSLLTDKSMYPPLATRFPRRVVLFFPASMQVSELDAGDL